MEGEVAQVGGAAEAVVGQSAMDDKEQGIGSEVIRELAAAVSEAASSERGRGGEVRAKGVHGARNGKARSQVETDDVAADDVAAVNNVAAMKMDAVGVPVVPLVVTVAMSEES